MSSNAQFERQPAGHIIIDGEVVADTKQCCHCNKHFISYRGSGQVRGFCRNCMNVTCGKKSCDICTPFEAVLEVLEGKTNRYKDLIVGM